MIEQSNLKQILSYDCESGVFTWLRPKPNQVLAGTEAGWIEPSGYRRISIRGKNYQAHRLAWLYMTGELPVGQVDHRNLNKSDNRWCNLRLATNSQNQANRPASKRSSSGCKGVYWHKRIRKWQASIMVGGRLRCLGYRENQAEAVSLYAAAAKEYFGEFARVA